MNSFLPRYHLAIATYECAFDTFILSCARVAACREADINVRALADARVKFAGELRKLGFLEPHVSWHLQHPGKSFESDDGVAHE